MGAERVLLTLSSALLFFGAEGQSLLKRPVDVHGHGIRLNEALAMVARDGGFKLSYNAAILPGDSLVSIDATGTAEAALRDLIGGARTLKESGDHVIILEARQAKDVFEITGALRDRNTGRPIAQASIREVNERYAGITAADGSYRMRVSGRRERTPLLIARVAYHDTVVFVGRDGHVGTVTLRPRDHLERLEPCHSALCASVDDLGVTRLLVPSSVQQQANNLAQEKRFIQLSLVPTVGTSGKLSGATTSRISLNIVAGYVGGVNGFEAGGAVNMVRRDVRGVQMAGAANLVGGHTKGLQLAGAINHTMRSLNGAQIGGLGNVVWDTLSGMQLAGALNVVKGGMQGTQISGLANLTTRSCDGTQVSGGINAALGDVRKAQISGLANYGRNVSSTQFSFGTNVALGDVGGGQVGFLANYARTVSGGQVGFGINACIGEVRGGQVGSLNVARKCVGGQVGLVNLSDTISGNSVGLLSIALRGYHRVDLHVTEVLPLTIAARTGTPRFYNLFTYSPAVDSSGRWGFGYGSGTEVGYRGRHRGNIEWFAEHVNEQVEWIDAINIVGRISLTYGYVIKRRLIISAGPSFNVLFTDWRDAETGAYRSGIAPYTLFEEAQDALLLKGWVGGRLAVGVYF
ncbi:MAG: hypothetical protein IPG10_15185 [Flavobacteriales bacterium]|nr:hypothetical protein [Flavobacteriales bacterium]MBK9074455.1 hypothetical protein [Flavobacteriales bacterium]